MIGQDLMLATMHSATIAIRPPYRWFVHTAITIIPMGLVNLRRILEQTILLCLNSLDNNLIAIYDREKVLFYHSNFKYMLFLLMDSLYIFTAIVRILAACLQEHMSCPKGGEGASDYRRVGCSMC